MLEDRRLNQFLNAIGFKNNLFDPCVFNKLITENLIIIEIDGLIFAKQKYYRMLLSQSQNEFEITICNEIKFLSF